MPDQSLNGSARLSQFILDNAGALRAGTAVIPPSCRAAHRCDTCFRATPGS